MKHFDNDSLDYNSLANIWKNPLKEVLLMGLGERIVHTEIIMVMEC